MKKERNPADSVQYVEQLLKPLPEHWVAWLNLTTAQFLQKLHLEMKAHEESVAAKDAAAGHLTQRWSGESAYVINGQTRDRAATFLRIVNDWISLPADQRDDLVRHYSRAWTIHVITRNVPDAVPLVPRHIKFFRADDYARMTKFIDDYQAAVNAAKFARTAHNWNLMPDTLVKLLLEGTFRFECRSVYAPFFDAFANDTLKDVP